MTTYIFRIMACLPGHQPVELYRSRRKYNQSYWNAVTGGLDRSWSRWCEHRMPNEHTITRRHPFAR